jgi:BirA family biotin operon repressor/biotin-[acetyl-CoA-carboxylase] ligase
VNLPPAITWRLQVHETLSSTSDLCLSRAQAGDAEGLAVLAMRQTSPRGTRGRSWSQPEGNLALSVLLRPDAPAKDAGRWAFVAGLAMVDALAEFTSGPPVLRLKWPNDVLLYGRKLAGVLIETAATPDGRLKWLVIGFGANLAVAPEVPGRLTASLSEVCPAPTPGAVAARLLDQLAVWSALYSRQGFLPIRDSWLARAHPLGETLRVVQGGEAYSGAFAGLSADGSLQLQTGGELRAFATGDVLLGG